MDTKVCKGKLCAGKELSSTEFSQRSPICRKCNCYNIKEHYKKNGRAYRNYKNEVKDKSKCEECGCTDIRLLEFDHIGEKNMNISKSFSKTAIKKELELVRVLCVWCHRLHTRKQMDEIKVKTNETFNIINRPINLEEGRKCIGKLCKGSLQYKTEFYTSVKASVCKVCNSYDSRLKRENNFNFVNSLKLSLKKCELCNISVTDSNTTCFDFDHLRDKKIEISALIKRNKDTTKEILEESKKCRLLCCKCHKLVTCEQLNYKYSKPECVQESNINSPSYVESLDELYLRAMTL
jgi:hypothetical protein